MTQHRRLLGLLALLGAFSPSSSFGWENHQSLMPWVTHGLPEKSFSAPCSEQDAEIYQKLIPELGLNATRVLPPTVSGLCTRVTTLTNINVLESGAVDDPDRGMDQDLDADALIRQDPRGDQKWMGGSKGLTSQGFRHMYFAGWTPFHPIRTIQVPPRSLGLAPDRALIMANRAREFFRVGNPAWGYRTLAWAMHYIQDLAQPFHSVQIVNLKMVPWSNLFQWPPSQAYSSLLSEATRSIANYHFAYEGYTYHQILQGVSSPFASCMSESESHATISFDPKSEDPKTLALKVAAASVKLAGPVGSAEIALLGDLREPGIDLVNHHEQIDYDKFIKDPGHREARERLHEATCPALANAVYASRKLIDWALQP